MKSKLLMLAFIALMTASFTSCIVAVPARGYGGGGRYHHSHHYHGGGHHYGHHGW